MNSDRFGESDSHADSPAYQAARGKYRKRLLAEGTWLVDGIFAASTFDQKQAFGPGLAIDCPGSGMSHIKRNRTDRVIG